MTQRDLFRPTPRPWNRGRIIGPKPPFKAKHVWAIRQQLKVAGGCATSPCSTVALTQSCGVATSSSSGSATWRPVARCVQEQP